MLPILQSGETTETESMDDSEYRVRTRAGRPRTPPREQEARCTPPRKELVRVDNVLMDRQRSTGEGAIPGYSLSSASSIVTRPIGSPFNVSTT